MSATERLRQLLDERGVEWADNPLMRVGGMERGTLFDSSDGRWVRVNEALDGTLCASHLTPEQAIAATLGPKITGETSDGYHTFNELYHHRALLFSVIVHDHRDIAWKSRKHYDGTMYDGMFIVGVETPWGQATYHYDYDPYWPMFDCRELLTAPEWDGHTPSDAIERIARLASKADDTCHIEGPRVADTLEHDCPEFILYCDQCGHGFGYVNYNDEGTARMHETPRFCPNCGRRTWRP